MKYSPDCLDALTKDLNIFRIWKYTVEDEFRVWLEENIYYTELS